LAGEAPEAVRKIFWDTLVKRQVFALQFHRRDRDDFNWHGPTRCMCSEMELASAIAGAMELPDLARRSVTGIECPPSPRGWHPEVQKPYGKEDLARQALLTMRAVLAKNDAC
jgi:hypothetical protein